MNTLAYMLAEDSRRKGKLWFLVPTKQDRSSVQEDAVKSFETMSKLLHGWLSRSRKERIRDREVVQGGAYKIEATVSRYSFEDWSWHYHANVIVQTDDPEQMIDGMRRAIPFRMSAEVLGGDWLKEFCKYCFKGINEKQREWNCDPYVEGPIRLLEDLLRLQKRRSLSFFGSYWGIADRVEAWTPKREARRMIWTTYPPLERRLAQEGRLEPVDDVSYPDVMEMVIRKAQNYSKLYERAIDEFTSTSKQN